VQVTTNTLNEEVVHCQWTRIHFQVSLLNDILHLVNEENKTTAYTSHKLQSNGLKASLVDDKLDVKKGKLISKANLES